MPQTFKVVPHLLLHGDLESLVASFFQMFTVTCTHSLLDKTVSHTHVYFIHLLVEIGKQCDCFVNTLMKSVLSRCMPAVMTSLLATTNKARPALEWDIFVY